MTQRRYVFMGNRNSCEAIAEIIGVERKEVKRIEHIEQLYGVKDIVLILCHGWEKKFVYNDALRIHHYCRSYDIPVLEVDY